MTIERRNRAVSIPGRTRLWGVALLAISTVVVVTASGCARDRSAQREEPQPSADKLVETVTARAPFDLSCPADQIQVVKLGELALGAMGCGRQTSYSCLCTYHVWFKCTQVSCSLDGSNIAQPPVLQGQPPSSQPEPLPPT
jgi:hypothetical protein